MPKKKKETPATTASQIFLLRKKLFKARIKCFKGSSNVPKIEAAHSFPL